MERLTKLLNEYAPLNFGEMRWDVRENGAIVFDDKVKAQGHSGEVGFEKKEFICGKEFGFIQWLVKHFMLDITKIDARIALLDFNATDRMLMALAISEDPIALLVDCLKQDGETHGVVEGIGDMENKR